MAELIVLCPTRGRPEAALEAYQSFVATATLETTEIVFVVDNDDPKLDEYLSAPYSTIHLEPPGNMVKALNEAAIWALGQSPRYLGFIGDDHRFRTSGWDSIFSHLLAQRGGGMVYANDTIRTDGDIPTQIFMSAEIVETLGWMGLPTCTHLYIDNVWRVIGDEIGMLFYMPDVIIEHLHPAAGKVDWDEGHLRVNTQAMYQHDAQAFSEWLAGSAKDDIERVRKVMRP